jgi:hypothetical protein
MCPTPPLPGTGHHDTIVRGFLSRVSQGRGGSNGTETTDELKRELDRLGVYQEYEDRFLDLFKKPE